jgi:hypothetical protein
MGVSTSLMLGDLDRVTSLEPYEMPESDVVITKVLDTVTMTHLHAIVMGGSYEELADHYMENPVFMLEPENEWLWVFAVPDALVARFAQLTDDELARAAQAFHQIDEMQQWYVSGTWVRDLLTEIRALCARAIRLEKQVFLHCML